MKEFGYFKIASLLYFLMMVMGMIMETNQLILLSVFLCVVVIVFYIFQKFLYTPSKIKVNGYDMFFFKTFKDTFLISLCFIILSVGINLVLVLAFYSISNNSLLNELISVKTLVFLFISMLLSLIFSNFLFYKFSYKKEAEDSDIKSTPTEKQLVLGIKTDKEENTKEVKTEELQKKNKENEDSQNQEVDEQ